MKKIIIVTLLAFGAITNSQSQKQSIHNTNVLGGIGLSDGIELEKKTFEDGQIELLLPKGYKELIKDELKNIYPLRPPKYGFINSDKSVVVEIRYFKKLKDGDVDSTNLDSNKEFIEVYFANNLNGTKHKHEIIENNSKRFLIVDWDIDWDGQRLACYYISTIYKNNFFVCNIKYPIIDRQKSQKLRQLILDSVNFKE